MNQNSIPSDKLLEIINIQTEVVRKGMDLSGIMDLVTYRAQQITDAHGACVELVVKNELVYSASSGMAEKFLGLRLSTRDSLSGESIKLRKTLICSNIEEDHRVNKSACRKVGLKSMIVTPLICGNDVVGVLKVLSADTDHFTEDSIKVLELMSGLIAASMFHVMRNEESELYHKATHDSLTGISNRSLFYDRLRQKLSQALLDHPSFGIISLDMDGLKEINDNSGHRAGDAAIKEVALRIKKVLRECDTVSRLGGDEFAILVASASEKKALLSVMKRIENEIMKPFEFECKNIKLSVSIGAALFGEDGTQLEELIEKADKEMYEMKKVHKGLIKGIF